jgi:TolA-binding protein
MKLTCALAALFFGALVLGARAQTGAPSGEDFGQYLAAHQADLAPFFAKNSGEFVTKGMPLMLRWLGRIMLATLVVGWILDVALSRGFSGLFAPALARLTRAVVYATGRLVISIILTVLFSLAVVLVSGLPYLGVVVVSATILFALLVAFAQVAWIRYLYHTDGFISLLFFITLAVIHGFVALGISAPLVGAPASDEARGFVDDTIVPKLEDEAAATRKSIPALYPDLDKGNTEVATLQDQISQSGTDIEQVKQQIEEQKKSPGYLYSQLVKVHAGGDLDAAQSGFTDFLTRFPDTPFTGLAKGQLNQVQNELATQATLKKQADATAAAAAAQARADLLARAAKGEVTLSQMRAALIGKTRDEVAALFGTPAETASDRWGYAQQMILNPLTGDKYGLTIYFTEGTVQGVDYYYGGRGGSQ